jgi:hypothetical protein
MKKQIFRECLRIAREKNNPGSHPEWGFSHHFTFVIQRNKIIEYGTNMAGPPPPGYGYPREFGKIHSEVAAWRRAKGIIDPGYPIDIINIRLNKSNELRMSRPCHCCNNFLRTLDCRHVYYSTEHGFSKMINFDENELNDK